MLTIKRWYLDKDGCVVLVLSNGNKINTKSSALAGYTLSNLLDKEYIPFTKTSELVANYQLVKREAFTKVEFNIVDDLA